MIKRWSEILRDIVICEEASNKISQTTNTEEKKESTKDCDKENIKEEMNNIGIFTVNMAYEENISKLRDILKKKAYK